MAQENNKTKPDVYEKGSNDKDRRGPRFSIYWIYALIAIGLIGARFFSTESAPTKQITEQQFKQSMLKEGDVAKIDKIRNKQLVRVYIKPESLSKPLYKDTLGIQTNQETAEKSPLFEFS